MSNIRNLHSSSTTTINSVLTYAAEGGLSVTKGMAAYVARRVGEGFSPELLEAVLDETFLAPFPSWRYFCAILKKLDSEGVKTVSAWDARQTAFASGKAGRPCKTVSGHLFGQREYTAEELDQLFHVDLDTLNEK